MRMIVALGAVIALTLFAAPLAADGEFKDGWNTWETTKKGDWAEYKSKSGLVKRYEVLEAKDGNIKLKLINTGVDAKGNLLKPTEQELKPAHWKKITVPGGRVAPSADWTQEKVKVGISEVDADIATWFIGRMTFANTYAKEVPCGGMVTSNSDGTPEMWLVKWCKGGKEFGDIKLELPKFWAKVGNACVLSKVVKSGETEDTTYSRIEIKKVDGLQCTFSTTPCDKDGKSPKDATPVSTTRDASDLTKPYAKPERTGEKITVPAGEFTCDVVISVVVASDDKGGGTTTTTTWITPEGLIVKRTTDDGTSQTTEELMSVKTK